MDVVHVRPTVRAWMVEKGFGLGEQTKMVTAASELVRGAVDYGSGGVASLEQLLEAGDSAAAVVDGAAHQLARRGHHLGLLPETEALLNHPGADGRAHVHDVHRFRKLQLLSPLDVHGRLPQWRRSSTSRAAPCR